MPTNCSPQSGWNLSLVVAVGCERVMAHDVTLGAYDKNKFLEIIQTNVIPSLDRQILPSYIYIDTHTHKKKI